MLRLVVGGTSTSEIALILTIVPGTVKCHLHSIYSKLDVRNRVQMVDRVCTLSLLSQTVIIVVGCDRMVVPLRAASKTSA